MSMLSHTFVSNVKSSCRKYPLRGMATQGAANHALTSHQGEWSHSMSFASPESDFTASDRFSKKEKNQQIKGSESHLKWSKSMSFASPESDFTSPTFDAISKDQSGYSFSTAKNVNTESLFLSLAPFSSPETAFGSIHAAEMMNDELKKAAVASLKERGNMLKATSKNQSNVSSKEIPDHSSSSSKDVSFEALFSSLAPLASPETALGSIHVAEMMDDELKNAVLVSLKEQKNMSTTMPKVPDHITSKISEDIDFDTLFSSLAPFASPETALGSTHIAEMIDDELKNAIMASLKERENMPKTMSEALADPRPIVVTSRASPFNIVDVNQAWVGLCEYSREEAVSQNLGKLLHGPETNHQNARDMVSRLKRNHFTEEVLVNYTKTGRKFKNHLRVGVLANDDGKAEYFVGILEDIGHLGQNKVSM